MNFYYWKDYEKGETRFRVFCLEFYRNRWGKEIYFVEYGFDLVVFGFGVSLEIICAR